MDKTFEDIISETLDDFQESSVDENVEEVTTEEAESEEPVVDTEVAEDSEVTEEEPIEDSDDSLEDEDLDVEDEDNSSPSTNDKDVQAFIQLRQLNKQIKDENEKYKTYVDFIDDSAKKMGMSGIDEFVEKAKEAQLKQNAEKQGVPVEVLKELEELKETVANQEALRIEAEERQEEARLTNTFELFVQKNHLDDNAVVSIAKDLTEDGISLDDLKGMSDNAINRILNSYLPKEVEKQNELAKKSKIRKELPVNNDSKSSTKGQEDQLDAIAKAFARVD